VPKGVVSQDCVYKTNEKVLRISWKFMKIIAPFSSAVEIDKNAFFR